MNCHILTWAHYFNHESTVHTDKATKKIKKLCKQHRQEGLTPFSLNTEGGNKIKETMTKLPTQHQAGRHIGLCSPGDRPYPDHMNVFVDL